MRLKKPERLKALSMVNGWGQSYENRLAWLSRMEAEFMSVAEEQEHVKYDCHLIDCVTRMNEMRRDMRILLRQRELITKAFENNRFAKCDALFIEFFQSRKSYADKWAEIEVCVKDVYAFLQSCTG